MHWAATDTEVEKHYDTAHSIMDALIKGGLTEVQARQAVEDLWDGGRQHGYDDGCYDSTNDN